ncbi:MAG: YfhO family protein, partial [Anaerolineae bacterium]|nr:YfhO family protein [Anaerolineae bacterium]
ANGDYWGYAAFWEDAVYMGILPLLLALIGVNPFRFKNPGKDIISLNINRWVNFGRVVLVITIILALGYNTPVYPFLYHYVPTFSMFNAPARLMVIIIFFISCFAGMGVSYWKKPFSRDKKRLEYLTVSGLAIILGGAGACLLIKGINPTVFQPVILMGALIFGSGLILINSTNIPGLKQTRWSIIVIVFVMGDLLLAGINFNPTINMDFFKQNEVLPDNYPEQGRIFIDQSNEYALKFQKYLRFKDFSPPGDWERMREAQLPNINMLDRVYSASNFDPLVYGRYQTWLDRFETANKNQKEKMLKLMNVHTLLMANIRGNESGVVPVLTEAGGWVSWANCVLPAVNEKEALEKTIDIKNQNQIVLEGYTGPLDCNNSPGHRTSKITELTAQQVVIETQSDGTGWLRLAYLNYPGWQVKIDGSPAHLYKADYLFWAVLVPSGKHTVEFEYVPVSFFSGLLVSLMGLVGLVFLWKKAGWVK